MKHNFNYVLTGLITLLISGIASTFMINEIATHQNSSQIENKSTAALPAPNFQYHAFTGGDHWPISALTTVNNNIFVGTKGHGLWKSTDNGVRFNKIRFYLPTGDDFTINNLYTTEYNTDYGNGNSDHFNTKVIWVCANNGYSFYSLDNGTTFNLINFIVPTTANILCINFLLDHHTILFGSSKGLYIYEYTGDLGHILTTKNLRLSGLKFYDQADVTDHPSTINGRAVNGIYEYANGDAQNVIVFGTGVGLWTYTYNPHKTNSWSPKNFFNQKYGIYSYEEIISVVGVKDKVYAGTRNGLFESQSPTHYYNNSQGINPYLEINNLYVDHNANIWINSQKAGTYECLKGQDAFNHINVNKAKVAYNSTYQDNDGNIWVGSGDAGLYCWSSGLSYQFKNNDAVATYVKDDVEYTTNAAPIDLKIHDTQQILSQVNINGVVIINLSHFQTTLTGKENQGIYCIHLVWANGTITNLNFWIKDSIDLSQVFSVSKDAVLKIYTGTILRDHKYVDVNVICGTSLNDNVILNCNLALNNTLIDWNNAFYQQLNIQTLLPISGQTFALKDNLQFGNKGLFLLTVNDVFGNKIQYYVQIGGNSKYIAETINWSDMVGPAKKKQSNHLSTQLIIIISLASVLFAIMVGVIITIIFYHRVRNVKAIKSV